MFCLISWATVLPDENDKKQPHCSSKVTNSHGCFKRMAKICQQLRKVMNSQVYQMRIIKCIANHTPQSAISAGNCVWIASITTGTKNDALFLYIQALMYRFGFIFYIMIVYTTIVLWLNIQNITAKGLTQKKYEWQVGPRSLC